MKFRIVYFMDHSTALGGAAHTLLRQAVLMKNAGNEVMVVVSHILGKVCEDYLRICREEAIPTVTLNYTVTNQPEGISICSVMESYEDVERLLQEKKPNIVHSVQLNIAVELVCREFHIPHIMNIYPVLPEFFKLPYADVFPGYHICDSQYYAKFWHTYAGTDSYCVRTMAPDALEPRKNMNKKQLHFICVGDIYEMKNQLEVIKAFGQAVREGICGKLDLWGRMNDSGYWEECRTYIEEKQLEKVICLHGFTSDMEAVYQDSDVLICGSRRESYPNAVSEALAHGLIVLSVPVAGVPEVIRDRENGYLCEGYEAEHILQKIKAFIKDCETGYIDSVMENAEKTYRKVHSPQAVKEQIVQCYEEIRKNFERRNVTTQYSISDMKEEFGGIIDIYEKNKKLFSRPEWVKQYLWQIKYVVDEIRRNRNHTGCFIWGTGKYGGLYKEILDVFAPDINFKGFIDTYKTGTFMGYPIINLEHGSDRMDLTILVGVLKHRRQILDELTKYGFQYNEDVFVLDALNW